MDPIPAHSTNHALTTAGKWLPIASLVVTALFWVSNNVNQANSTAVKTEQNTIDIEHIRSLDDERGRQLDKDIVALKEQARTASQDNHDLQQEVHDLNGNLQRFENRFIVTSTTYPDPAAQRRYR